MGDHPTTHVLLCADWRNAIRLMESCVEQGLRADVVPQLCARPEAMEARLSDNGTGGLVLGLCRGEYSLAEMQAHSRKAGLDALGVEIVHLRELPPEKAKILLSAAAARAAAYPGSKPAHAKPGFPPARNRRAFFKRPLLEYQAAPAIDESRCAAALGCDVCATVCSRTAPAWRDGAIHYDKEKCDLCGRCVTACPREAIVNPAITPAQVEAEVRAILESSPEDAQVPGILFTCRDVEPRSAWHPRWMPVKLPCVGMAPPSWLLAPLLMGASAVGVHPSGNRCRRSLHVEARGSAGYCREILKRMGASPDAVVYCPSLSETPSGSGRRTDVDGLFGRHATANILLALSRERGAPIGLSLDHPHSPLGVVEIDEERCTGCAKCAEACPADSLSVEQTDDSVCLLFDAARCTACGQCLRKCPEGDRGAIRLRRLTDVARLARGKTEIYRDERAACLSCGKPLPPNSMMARIETLLSGAHAVAEPTPLHYCVDCRRSVAGSVRSVEPA